MLVISVLRKCIIGVCGCVCGLYNKGSGQEWYISGMLYSSDIPIWSRTLDNQCITVLCLFDVLRMYFANSVCFANKSSCKGKVE